MATSETHKFEKINEINIDKLKLPPIIVQTGTYFYKAGKVIAEYLKALTKNEFVITNTKQLQSMINKVPFSDDEEDVSYDAQSLFTKTPTKEVIDFICDEIYHCKTLKPICKQSMVLLWMRLSQFYCRYVDDTYKGRNKNQSTWWAISKDKQILSKHKELPW